MLKIQFKKPIGEVLFININSKNKDETIIERGVKTLYLKCDDKMSLRKLFILIRKMIQVAKNAKVEKICFDFNDFRNLISSSIMVGTKFQTKNLLKLLAHNLILLIMNLLNTKQNLNIN